MSEIIEKLNAAKAEYVSALARGSGVVIAKERIKNMLFNFYDQLIEALIENESLRAEVDALDAALQEADDELKKMKKPKKTVG